MTHKDKVDLVRKVHEIFCGLTGKRLALVTCDPPSRTDTETYIGITLEDPDVVVIHKHEWSHVLFRTDLYARDEFVRSYMAERHLSGPPSEIVINDVCNAFDDLRVLSLHFATYPGSALDLARRWTEIVQSGTRGNLILRIMGIGMRLGAAFLTGANWAVLDPIIERGAKLVDKAGYSAVLLASRLLLDELTEFADSKREREPLVGAFGKASRRIVPPKKYDPDEAMREMEHVEKQARGAKLLMDQVRPPINVHRNSTATAKTVEAAMGHVTDAELEALLHDEAREVRAIVLKLSSTQRVVDVEKDLTKDLHNTRIVPMDSSDVETFELGERDLQLAATMRRTFVKLHDQRTRAHSSEGSFLDTQRYIEFLFGSGDDEYFVDEVQHRGFTMLLLLDMSGSVQGLWPIISRAAKVVVGATSFPYSKVIVWAFSGDARGWTTILDFKDVSKGYLPKKYMPEIWGSTPLHLAVPAAVRKLGLYKGTTKHLLIVSDGRPQHFGTHSNLAMREMMRQDIMTASRRHIRTSAVLLGHDLPDAEATKMFQHNWVRVGNDPEDLFHSMVDLSKKFFVNYLRR